MNKPYSLYFQDALAKAERELERREKSELMSRIDKLQSKEHELENLIHMSIAECGKNCKVREKTLSFPLAVPLEIM